MNDAVQAGMCFENTGRGRQRNGARRIRVIQVFTEDTWQAHRVARVRDLATKRGYRVLCSTLTNTAKWIQLEGAA